MSSTNDDDGASARLPLTTRRRLAFLDRLHETWSYHQTRRPEHQWAANRRRSFRRHLLELRAIAGYDGLSPEEATQLATHGWNAVPLTDEERGFLRLAEETLVTLSDACRDGQRLCREYLRDLAESLPDVAAPLPLSDADYAALADLAGSPGHPLVRAASLYHACRQRLDRARHTAGDRGPSTHARQLPWALASFVLMRASYPPLTADRSSAERVRAALHGPAPAPAVLIDYFCDLEAAILRSEISWPLDRPGGPPGTADGSRLATAIHRRIVERLRARSAPLAAVFREIDPEARSTVSAGDSRTEGAWKAQLERAAERAMFHSGPRHWWAVSEVTVAGSTSRLLVAVQDVGEAATGVLAVTAHAELAHPGNGGAVTPATHTLLDTSCLDCVTLLPTDGADERWPEVARFVDESVSRAMRAYTRSAF